MKAEEKTSLASVASAPALTSKRTSSSRSSSQAKCLQITVIIIIIIFYLHLKQQTIDTVQNIKL